jgi:uncharacterized membrane protein
VTLLIACFFLGWVTGLRSMAGPAVVCWAAHLGWLHFAGTKLAFISHPAMLIAFTLFALIELTLDKLPKTPPRTEPLGLIARLIFGCLCGISLAISTGGGAAIAAAAGVTGALAGTFVGYNIRQALVFRAHLPDFGVALAEDVIALAVGFLVASHR